MSMVLHTISSSRQIAPMEWKHCIFSTKEPTSIMWLAYGPYARHHAMVSMDWKKQGGIQQWKLVGLEDGEAHFRGLPRLWGSNLDQMLRNA